mmetsp:Transcript_15726/g.15198  ORF Transcript_15726/g.15198 Transcript_15726/m.15198 type:complete len:113 (-) Transcript_15726:464-802(-)
MANNYPSNLQVVEQESKSSMNDLLNYNKSFHQENEAFLEVPRYNSGEPINTITQKNQETFSPTITYNQVDQLQPEKIYIKYSARHLIKDQCMQSNELSFNSGVGNGFSDKST